MPVSRKACKIRAYFFQRRRLFFGFGCWLGFFLGSDFVSTAVQLSDFVNARNERLSVVLRLPSEWNPTLTFFSLIYLRSFYWGYSPVSDYRLHLLPDRLNKKPNRFFRDFQKIFNLFILQKNSTEFLDALTYCRVRYTAPGSNRALFFFANKRFAQVF